MNEGFESKVEGKPYSKLLVPSLVIARFAIQPSQILLSLLMIDIGLSFGYPVGIMGQISTAYSIAAFIAAVLMGAISVRFRHKHLLMLGLGFRVIAAIGCAYAPGYSVMLMLYLLNGLGTAFISPMTISLAAEHLPREKRAGAIGWIISGMALSYVVGSIGINYISGIGGWRLPYLVFVLPITLLGLIFVFFGVPSAQASRSEAGERRYLEGFKGIIANRSAVACLFGLMFSVAAASTIMTYSASFFRQRYETSTTFASLMFMGGASLYAVGSQVAGRLIKKIGGKRLWIIASIISAVGLIIALLGFNVWLSLGIILLSFPMLGMAFTASNNLTLIQVPEYRGTMMSLFSAANSLGIALGAASGGAILVSLGYSFLGVGIGLLSFLSVIVVYSMVEEPNRT